MTKQEQLSRAKAQYKNALSNRSLYEKNTNDFLVQLLKNPPQWGGLKIGELKHKCN